MMPAWSMPMGSASSVECLPSRYSPKHRVKQPLLPGKRRGNRTAWRNTRPFRAFAQVDSPDQRRKPMFSKRNLLLTGLVFLGSAGLAQAQMSATTMTDLDVRTGPGPQYPTVGMATRGSEATLDGCIRGSNWCRIDVNGMRGWVDAQTLAVEQNG